MSERPSYIKLILSFEGKEIKMGDWLDMMDASPKIREKLSPLGLATIKFQKNVFYPAIVSDEKGGTRFATFVFDHTDKHVAENFLDWVYDHQDEIKRGNMQYLYVEDTKQRRFAHKIDRIGLRDCIIKRTGEKAYPREKMIEALQSMVDSIPSLDIPATISEIRVFGSMVRGKPLVGDIDLLVKYKFDAAQELRIMLLYSRLGEEPRALPYCDAKIWELYHLFKKIGAETIRKAREEAVAAAEPGKKESLGEVYDFFTSIEAIIAEGEARKRASMRRSSSPPSRPSTPSTRSKRRSWPRGSTSSSTRRRRRTSCPSLASWWSCSRRTRKAVARRRLPSPSSATSRAGRGSTSG